MHSMSTIHNRSYEYFFIHSFCPLIKWFFCSYVLLFFCLFPTERAGCDAGIKLVKQLTLWAEAVDEALLLVVDGVGYVDIAGCGATVMP